MKTELTKHAKIRAGERVTSERLCNQLFRKALRGVKKGTSDLIVLKKGVLRLRWMGWEFIFAQENKNGKIVHTLITVYKSKAH